MSPVCKRRKPGIRDGAALVIDHLAAYVPLACLLCVPFLQTGIHIEPLQLYVKRSAFIALSQGLMAVWTFLPVRRNKSDGLAYRFFRGILPPEMLLFAVFAQYQFAAAVGILATVCLIMIACAVLTPGMLTRQGLARTGPAARSRRGPMRPNRQASMLRVRFFVMRRCLVLSLGIALLVPSALTLRVYGLRQPALTAKPHVNALAMANGDGAAFPMDKVALLQEDVWDLLSMEERLDALQTIVDIESAHWHMQPLTLCGVRMDDMSLGSYAYNEKRIQINTAHLMEDGPSECLITVLHECRHAYQNDVVDMLDWTDRNVQSHPFYQEARLWRENLFNYISGEDGQHEYYEQLIETDARQYAQARAWVYERYIASYR